MPTSSYLKRRDSGSDILSRIRTTDDSVELAVIADGEYFRVVAIMHGADGTFTRHDTVGCLDNGEVATAQMCVMHAAVVALQLAGFGLPSRPALRAV